MRGIQKSASHGAESLWTRSHGSDSPILLAEEWQKIRPYLGRPFGPRNGAFFFSYYTKIFYDPPLNIVTTSDIINRRVDKTSS